MVSAPPLGEYPTEVSYLHPPRTVGHVLAPTDRFPSGKRFLCTPRKVGQLLASTGRFPDRESSLCPPGTAGGFWHPPTDLLVVKAIHDFLGQQGRSWGLLVQSPLARSVHTPPGQQGWVLQPASWIPSKASCLSHSGSAEVGPEACWENCWQVDLSTPFQVNRVGAWPLPSGPQEVASAHLWSPRWQWQLMPSST